MRFPSLSGPLCQCPHPLPCPREAAPAPPPRWLPGAAAGVGAALPTAGRAARRAARAAPGSARQLERTAGLEPPERQASCVQICRRASCRTAGGWRRRSRTGPPSIRPPRRPARACWARAGWAAEATTACTAPASRRPRCSWIRRIPFPACSRSCRPRARRSRAVSFNSPMSWPFGAGSERQRDSSAERCRRRSSSCRRPRRRPLSGC
mmetsp:Transcript_131701/g.421365  ORF Transcript_131701/g.421365 Transcript_131701/m.421365 type:complete len:208 (-) Transcript_131701:1040-1663(-)